MQRERQKEGVEQVRQQQHTGNHEEDRPERKQGGADRFGGTRAGAGNVEPEQREKAPRQQR